MKKNLYILLVSLLSCSVFAGNITIEKSDSLIRNDIFDEKRARAEDYKQRESERNENNQYWSSQIDPSCGLLKSGYLIYFCAKDGRYYKGYESGKKTQYRELSTSEVKKIRVEKH